MRLNKLRLQKFKEAKENNPHWLVFRDMVPLPAADLLVQILNPSGEDLLQQLVASPDLVNAAEAVSAKLKSGDAITPAEIMALERATKFARRGFQNTVNWREENFYGAHRTVARSGDGVLASTLETGKSLGVTFSATKYYDKIEREARTKKALLAQEPTFIRILKRFF